jgi:Rrf2 family protein
MFALSTKAIYGIAAALELALAQHAKPLQVKEIARAQVIPESYLRQLLISLKRAKIVESARGAKGGYLLRRAPAEITVKEIIEAMEGRPNFSKMKLKDPALWCYLKGCEREVENIFSVTLEVLVVEKQRHEQSITYQI